MSWLGRAISSVGQYYKEINPATLSGAIDVIVVSSKRPSDQADQPEGTLVEDLACSPWHVRFGKLSVLRPVERKVRILINDQPAPFSMKIGETGEAFFVFETDVDDLPDDLQTSPLVSPFLESVGKKDQGPASTALENVPDFDDLGERQLASDSSDWAESDAIVQDSCEPDLPSPKESRKKSESETLNKKEDVREQTHDPEDSIKCSPILERKEKPVQLDAESLQLTVKGKGNYQNLSPTDPTDGDDVREAARAQDPESLLNISNEKHSPSAELLHSPHHLHQGSNQAPGDLMLDMEGYKMAGDTDDDLTRSNIIPQYSSNKHPSPNKLHSKPLSLQPSKTSQTSDDHERLDVKEGEVMEFTKALLTCSERINNRISTLDSTSPTSIEQKINIIVNALENDGHSMLSEPHASRAEGSNPDSQLNEDDAERIMTLERVEDPDGLGAYDKFKLHLAGVSHVFELSLYTLFDDELDSHSLDDTRCRGAHHQGPRPFNRQKFNENRMTFNDFFTRRKQDLKQDLIDEEANILVKYNDQYILTWDNASTALTSMAIYRKSILTLCQSKTLHVIDGAVRIVGETPTDQVPRTPEALTTKMGEEPLVHKRSHSEVPPSTSPKTKTDKSTLPVPASYTRPWSRWWYKNDGTSSSQLHHRHHSEEVFKANEKPTTPSNVSDVLAAQPPAPVSPPDSPRSLPEFEVDRTKEPTSDNDSLPNRPRSTSVNATQEPTRTPSPPPRKHYAKTLRLTSDQLKQLGLKKGMNQVSFSVRSSYSGYAVCTSRIFLWDSDYKICISDIDGTITKSDALGHVFTMIGRDWTHAGVAKLYTDIARNGYKLMYLTSRAIGQADTTREYLKGINQVGYTLPDGPVIMSPDRLMTSLHREVIMRKPEVFKMACLRDIQRLFGPDRKPFYAGFGNRITDALSYRTVEIPSSRIFTIDSNGEVKMELLELTGYKSSYIHMTDLVDQMFPPINRSSAMPEFTDFNFWRSTPSSMLLNELDLNELLSPNFATQAPVSPALSARSLESTTAVSRLSFRLSSLSLGRKVSKADLGKTSTQRLASTSSRTREASPGSPLARPTLDPDPTTPRTWETSHVIEEGSDDEGMEVPTRMRSDSMPGSLPGSLEEQSLLESLRRESFEINPRRKRVEQEAEMEEEETEGLVEDEGEANVEDEDDFPQMDFSEVPYL